MPDNSRPRVTLQWYNFPYLLPFPGRDAQAVELGLVPGLGLGVRGMGQCAFGALWRSAPRDPPDQALPLLRWVCRGAGVPNFEPFAGVKTLSFWIKAKDGGATPPVKVRAPPPPFFIFIFGGHAWGAAGLRVYSFGGQGGL